MYLVMVLNHFRAVQKWALERQAAVHLDLSNFNLEVRYKQMQYVLYPQFITKHQTTYVYSSNLTDHAMGFIGWLPYKPVTWPALGEKLEFKRFMQEHGLPTPPVWMDGRPSEDDYVLKRTIGSFGQAVFGPYHPSSSAEGVRDLEGGFPAGSFAEKFIVGKNLKVWFWGGEPFHAHLDPYQTVRGNGKSTIEQLISMLVGHLDLSLADNDNKTWILSSLEYQKRKPSDVLSDGEEIWIDFRYGRVHTSVQFQFSSDSVLNELSQDALSQIRKIGQTLNAELSKTFKLPTAYAVDGVMDADGTIWWLEANANPMFPPSGYPLVFSAMFDRLDVEKAPQVSDELVVH